MEMWIKEVVTNENVQLTLISIGIFLLFLVLRKMFIKYVYVIVLKLSRKSPTEFFSYLLTSFEKTLQYIFVIIGLYVSMKYFPYISHKNELFVQLIRSGLVFSIAIGLYNLAEHTSVFFAKINDRGKVYLDHIISTFLSRILRFVIVAISIAIVADIFGYNVNGFVAGLGLGGLAFALAAQDAISNLFGGFIIVTEKPFTLGDWVETPSIEGFIEDITFRSTKVRTFADGLVSVPNATLVNEPITNWSKMGKREVNFNVTITYDTSAEKIKQFTNKMDTLLNEDDEIDKELIFVRMNEYGEHGIKIFIYFFTKATTWGEYLRVRERINYEIMQALHEYGIEIAIPSRKLYTEKEVNVINNNQTRERETE